MISLLRANGSLARDGAADGLGGRLRHGLAGQHLVESLTQIEARGPRVLFQTREVAVIDAAAVTQDKVVIEDERRGHGIGLEDVGGVEPLVLEHRERQLELGGLLGELRGVAVIAAVDGKEGHLFLSVRPGQFRQYGGVAR